MFQEDITAMKEIKILKLQTDYVGEYTVFQCHRQSKLSEGALAESGERALKLS